MKQLFQVKALIQSVLIAMILSIIGLVIRNDFQAVKQLVLSQEVILTNILKSTEANSLQLLDSFSLNILQTSLDNRTAINAFAENAIKEYSFVYMFGLVQTLSKDEIQKQLRQKTLQLIKLKIFSYDSERKWVYLEPKELNFPVTYVYPENDDTLNIIGLDISLIPFLKNILQPISHSTIGTNEETSLFNKKLVDPFELAEGGFGLSINKVIGKYYYNNKIYPKMIPSIVLKTKTLFELFNSSLSDVSLDVGFPKKKGSNRFKDNYWREKSDYNQSYWSLEKVSKKQFLGMELSIKLNHDLSLNDFSWLLIAVLIIFMMVVYFTINVLFMNLTNSQRRLSIVNEQLNETIESKHEMFSNISHELKTPLTLILLPLQKLLESESLGKRDRSRVELIERNSQRLLGLVERVMELTLVQSNQEPLELINIDEQIHRQILAFSTSFYEKAISFKFQLETPVTVQSTTAEIHSLLENLLSNALKYTDRDGWVTLRTCIKEEQFIIEIHNSHKGLTEIECKKVFQRFERLNQAESEQGHGLGLSLLRSICKKYQWNIECLSILNHSVLFRITISIFDKVQSNSLSSKERVKNVDKYSTDFKERRDMRPHLLIVEDNQDLREFLKEIFEENYSVSLAENGLIGLELATMQCPNMIISDIMMPKMDGFQLCDKLLENPITSHIPVILLTAKSDQKSRLKGLTHGAIEFMSKPFDGEELKLRVQNIIRLKQKQQSLNLDAQSKNKPMGNHISLTDKRFIDRFETVLLESYQDKNISILEIASKSAISERQLQRKVQALFGLNPSEYLKRYRLNHAKKLLQKGEAVTMAAELTGFSSQSYFSKAFKKQFSISPSQVVK
ncbi:MAG: hypothetical protein COA86_13475 [Kangiella sp.]|nr:MAG: hypothetical protein COA86_13475 [Kangiella sp.]